jgi:hypothetical protein
VKNSFKNIRDISRCGCIAKTLIGVSMTEEDEDVKQAFYMICRTFVISMALVILVGCMVTLCTGCQAFPSIVKAAEDIATDDAISIEVDRSAMQKDTDVHITVDVKNKEDPQQPFVVHSAPSSL